MKVLLILFTIFVGVLSQENADFYEELQRWEEYKVRRRIPENSFALNFFLKPKNSKNLKQ